MGRGVGHATTSARTVNHTALSLASSFRIASGTSSPCSFVDTMLHDALRQLVGGYAVYHDDESAVRDAHESEEEPGVAIHCFDVFF